MPSKSDVDFGKTAKDYAKYRAGFPDSFFTRLNELNPIVKNSRVLDLGTGTGTVARGLALKGANVIGLDPSDSLMQEAKELDECAGVKIQYQVGKAENIDFPASVFDVVVAGQCWHWFDQDAALKEIKRVLAPNGKLIVAYFDWIDVDGNPVDEMYVLRRKYNPSWKSSWPLGFYPQQPGDLKFLGYKSIGSFSYHEDVPYTHEGWRGRMRAYAGIGGSLPASVVDEFDREFAQVLRSKFPEEPMLIPHKVWVESWRVET